MNPFGAFLTLFVGVCVFLVLLPNFGPKLVRVFAGATPFLELLGAVLTFWGRDWLDWDHFGAILGRGLVCVRVFLPSHPPSHPL